MSLSPIVIIQLQRMGDVILSFPLLQQLHKAFPGHPLWVVGEPMFITPLMPLSPQATYFSFQDAIALRSSKPYMVINLSHRKEGALLAGQLGAETIYGQYYDSNGTLHTHGFWHLYRESLTQNNAYNLFHWADLYSLDCIAPSQIAASMCPSSPMPSRRISEGAHVGLFLGASEAAKHPEKDFWVELVLLLLRAGHKPVLLGGAAEKQLGASVASKAGVDALNLCGHFSVQALAAFMDKLDLLVTPDTGPMHLAVWQGTPVLNLSMGPVNAWETGPYFPGHHVLHAALPCYGCWQCKYKEQHCRAAFVPERVMQVIALLLSDISKAQGNIASAGLELLVSCKDARGLHDLCPVQQKSVVDLSSSGIAKKTDELQRAMHRSIALFWKEWFWQQYTAPTSVVADSKRRLSSMYAMGAEPASAFRQDLRTFIHAMTKLSRTPSGFCTSLTKHWTSFPASVHPVAGFLQMYCTNANGSLQAQQYAFHWVEQLVAILED